MKILLVEDDEILVASLAADLTSQNYVVEVVTDGKTGWEYAQATQYDLIVLDVNLPGVDGITLCRQLRQANYEGPILLLTAKGDSNYKIEGLDAGADDYVVKPCPTEELSARIRALLRRPREISSPILQWGALQLDPRTCQVYYADNDISLSPKEYGLLELFLRNPQRVFSSTVLLERLWGFDEMPGEETIRSHIKRLRRKLKSAGADEVIENIYGMGYRLMPAPSASVASPTDAEVASQGKHPEANAAVVIEAEATSPTSPTVMSAASPEAAAPVMTEVAAQAAARNAAIAALEQFSDVIAERLAILQTAATALETASLSDELRQEAQLAAHKLVGSLGMFGLNEGSRLSQDIEIGLQKDPATVDSYQLTAWIYQLRRDLGAVLGVATDKTEPTEPTEPSVDRADIKIDNPKEAAQPQVDVGKSPEASLPPILVISTDSDLLAGLKVRAQQALQVIQVETPLQAQQQLSQKPFSQHQAGALLLDMESVSGASDVQSFLTNVANTHPNLSVIVLPRQDTFEARLEVARYSSCTFLSRTTPISQIVDGLLEMYQRRCASSFHILVVDDDPVILKTLQQQLPPWGLQVTTLEDSRSLWEVLPQLKPDLLILDVEMPHVDGIELCQVIRGDRHWESLPILFLTARRDAKTVQQIFQAGADDYIAKPFAEPELVTRILNRLERQRLNQKLAIVDPITGLITEQQALRDISRDLAIAQRYRQPYCLAMIAVESPAISSARGQSWLGEQIICNIANVLSQRLRQEDLVTQTAANVFLLGLYGIHKQSVEGRLKTLVQELHEVTLKSLPDNTIALSFQIGLAASPEDGKSISTLRHLAQAWLE